MDKVACALCGKLMSNINNRHLQTHQITAADYRLQFPDSPLMSEEHAAKLSARSVAANETRKGVSRSDETRQRMREGQARYRATQPSRGAMSAAQKQMLSDLAHERYANGFVHPNTGLHHSDSVKQKISDALRGRIVGPDAARKAIATKRQRGYDMALFRGKQHTPEAKAKISSTIRAQTDENRQTTRAIMLERMQAANVSLINTVSADVFHLRCNICGHEFTRTPQCFHSAKFHLHICDQCFPISPVSQQEHEVAEFIESIADTRVIRSDMEALSPLELDIYLPDKHVAIEYCGLYWHSVACGKSRFYHRHKYDACRRLGIRLITIFEDEWMNARSIVQSMLRNALHGTSRIINARSCVIQELDTPEAIDFLKENHVQGRGRSKVKFGLRYRDELVAVMTFMDSEISHRGTGWEINRFCSKLSCSIRGGASKLFHAFVHQYHPDTVTSYADLRWGDGNVYGRIGFRHVGNTVPNYWYIKPNEVKRYSRFALRKTTSDTDTEFQSRQREGWNWIWDCGHAKWVYTSSTDFA